MEFQYKKNIKLVLGFEIGEKVLVKGWGDKLDGHHILEDARANFGGCESGVLVKISGYDDYIDSGWLTKV